MKLHKECSCCEATYVVAFSVRENPIEWPEESENADTDMDFNQYPEFCPFCGKHEADSEDDFLEEEE